MLMGHAVLTLQASVFRRLTRDQPAFYAFATCSLLYSAENNFGYSVIVRDGLWYRTLALRAAGLQTGVIIFLLRLYNVFEQFFKGGLLN